MSGSEILFIAITIFVAGILSMGFGALVWIAVRKFKRDHDERL